MTNNNIQIFENNDFGKIRVIEIDNEPWFVTGDVCKSLDITNVGNALARLDEDEKSSIRSMDVGSHGGNPNIFIVNEPGLYSLILGSRKKEAKEFKRWITHEVIPSIRRHGAYMTPETLQKAILNPDTLISLCNQLKDEMNKNEKLETKIEEDKPKVIFADAVSTSKTSILIGELAKILKQNGVNTGEKRLFDWLRNNGYLIKRKGTDYNAPTQKSIEYPYFCEIQ